MLHNFKLILKKNKLIFNINAYFKSIIFDKKLEKLKYFYLNKKNNISNYHYNDEEVKLLIKKNLNKRILKLDNSNINFPNILYAGTNKFQDEIIIQGLNEIGSVEIITRDNGEYGLHSKPIRSNNFLYDKETIDKNSKILLENIELKNNIHIIIGQFWANYLPMETLEKITSLGIILVNISMDDILPEHWGYYKNIRLGSIGLSSEVDFTLSTSKEICEWYFIEGNPAIYWPLASDPKIFIDNTDIYKEKEIDVIFVGRRYGIREEIVNFLIKNGIKVEAYGNGWKNGSISPEVTAKLFKKSKIILGVGTAGYSKKNLTLKLRDFDAPMSGSLYITHSSENLKNLYDENNEIVLFKDKFECLDKIKYYLDNPDKREIIANNGQIKAKNSHTWENRFKDMINIIKESIN